MSTPFLGEIRAFPFNFVPDGWLPCEGQTLTIKSDTALYAVIGDTFGGDGRTTYKLPDLRGRVPVGSVTSKTAPGWDPGAIGTVGGMETIALTADSLPPHSHPIAADANPATTPGPTGNFLASGGTTAQLIYTPADSKTTPVMLNEATIQPQGAGVPRPNVQPYLVMRYCICSFGLWPPHP